MILYIIEDIEIVRPIVQILHFLLCIYKNNYRSEIEIKKENLIKGNVGKKQKKRESKRIDSIREEQKEKKSK